MKTENVLYTDGHDVTVTDSVLQVRKKWYSLNGITKHGFSIIKPARLPGILSLGLGTLLIMAGALKLVDTRLALTDGSPDPNGIAIWIGASLLLVGTLLMWSLRERYAVSITTAEGEKHVVVSKRKEYITQIVHALNDAFFARIDPGQVKGHGREFTVSGR